MNNLKTIKRAEELRLNIEKTDKEIIQLEKIMQDLALQDGQGITLNLNLAKSTPKETPSRDNEIRGVVGEHGQTIVIDTNPSSRMQGIFKHMAEDFEDVINAGRTWMPESINTNRKIVKANFALTNAMALQFLTIYHASILDERALLFKLLQECIKTLQEID